ncbi:hypothetical protein ACFY12_13695 [Streptomyces sp. NPDC001339]|uniref:hypothetical protein n=1 Tax=Streptomyces sp. NPDC001339 TaxID=3364563 RepID=UPI0036B1B834
MVAPGFRSRIAAGLLVAAVVLPVPVGGTPAAASERRDTPADRSPDLIRHDDPTDLPLPETLGALGFGPDDFGVGDSLRALRPVGGRAGHPGPPARLHGLPDGFPGLPDVLEALPHELLHHPGHRHHRSHHPFGSGFPPYDIWYLDDGDLGLGGYHGHRHGSPHSNRAQPRPGHHGTAAKRRTPADPVPEEPITTARSAPTRRIDGEKRRTPRRDRTLPPLPAPSAVPKESSASESTDDVAGGTPGPYSLEAPTAPVERVLPMGAGLTLTGLGLAFFGLRLRRR